MVHAFIMVKTAPGRSEAVRDAVADMETVSEAHVVAGEFDVIVEADGGNVQDVLHAASTGVQGLDGVDDTKTYISLSA